MEEIMLKIENVSKVYKLGQIGGTTLKEAFQRLFAKIRRKEDPTKKLGAKEYKNGEKFNALDGVSFEVKKGERVGIIGHNGAGKSTLLKLISRITAPTTGTISMNGRVASMLEVGTGFHPELTGRENIYMNGAILGMTKKEIDSKIEDIIEFSECKQFIDTPVKRYSSGMYVKLAFSVAAHLDSEIMIMDEVLAVGDMAFQKKCLDKMREASNKDGRTVLYVSHNMNTIRQLCERCVVLDKGKVIFDGDVEEAIGIYLSKKKVEDSPYVDLAKLEHFDEMANGKARMLSMQYLDKKDTFFTKSEKIRILLNWHSNENLEMVRFRIQIKNQGDSPVGVVCSNPICDSVKDANYTTEFEFDTALLAEGKYTCSLSLFQNDELGNQVYVDHVAQATSFEIISNKEEKNKVNWSHKWWGSVQFPPLKIVNENNGGKND